MDLFQVFFFPSSLQSPKVQQNLEAKERKMKLKLECWLNAKLCSLKSIHLKSSAYLFIY